jgi:arylsulfatase A-like enzyme
LLVGVDTLRPDHLGCYGYARNTSPNIDRLAGRGVLLENTISQCPWTLPSFATVLTSLYPTQHGAGIDMNRLRTTFPTLANILSDNGYATGGIINVSVLSPEFGVDRGFDYYDATAPTVKRIADEITSDALEWIGLHEHEPFFLFVHYFDPHLSYSPPAPYDTLFDPDYEGRIGRSFDRDKYLEMKDDLFRNEGEQTAADWNHIRALYDGEIAFTDEAIGDLLQGLEKLDLRERTLIVFLSDHGEEFFEHKGYGHGHTLFREVIEVPLIFSLPGVLPEGVRLSRQVRLVDVMPTILDLLDIDVDVRLEGTSLTPWLVGEGRAPMVRGGMFPPEVAYSEGLRRGGERKSVATQTWKLIYDVATEEEILLNLEQDPGEMNNLAGENHDSQDLLEAMLFRSMFVMSETWYVEMAGGERPHTFDLRIAARRGGGMGKICMYRLLDDKQRIVRSYNAASRKEQGSALEIRDFRTARPVVLAFKAEIPGGVPVSFDVSIDGEPAPDKTYLGESLKNPREMPFARPARRMRVRSGSGPATRPEPPYCLIWHCENEYGAEVASVLGEDTKKDLRALGYIQ